ncbi:hypothetical protein GSI_04569 [Ganoderma sinense ZZ0214-1]|uniref:Uncharacterized protein n=1 Tax=Ganoderma sinense ZZ0214-1 TaxID=1077348 RepID=A0A2G8SH72_9APHY|nr:hypothetical protein GSI_04569 [Ganoderma sinense ZZ0214-1]
MGGHSGQLLPSLLPPSTFCPPAPKASVVCQSLLHRMSGLDPTAPASASATAVDFSALGGGPAAPPTDLLGVEESDAMQVDAEPVNKDVVDEEMDVVDNREHEKMEIDDLDNVMLDD